MTLLTRLAGGLRVLFRRRQAEQDLDTELRAYLESAVEQKMAEGMSHDDAVRAARVEIGSVEAVKDYTRDAGWESGLESVWQDVRYALRSFRRSPGFTAAGVITLALGIGGTTAIFSVVDALFLRAPDGVADPATLRKIFIRRDTGTVQTPEFGRGSWVDYATMRTGVPAFSGVAAYRGAALASLGRGPEAQQVRVAVVSHEFLDVLGVRPARGRLFREEEDGPLGTFPVAIISYGMWQARFGGIPDIVGRTILVDGQLLEIVGVTSRGFTGIEAEGVDVWLPSSAGRSSTSDGPDWRTVAASIFAQYVARLAPGATDEAVSEQASAALGLAAAASPRLDPTPEVTTTPLALAAAPYSTTTGNLSLWLALVAAFVLIVACASVANLLLARGLTRRRELAIRVAIGAGRWRVARQQLTESAVLALFGGAAGTVVAYWSMGLMRQFPIPPSAGRIDTRLLLFALASSLITGLLFGVLPAVRAARVAPVDDLKDSRNAGRAGRHTTRRVLLAVQVSLSLALVIGAALFVRSLREATAIDAGADLDRLLVASVNLSATGITAAEREQFFELALQRVAAVPGVERSAVAHLEPLSGASVSIPWRIPGRTGPNGQELQGAFMNVIGAGYFATAGTRLVRGREIEPSDRGQPVAVVNESLARLMADDGNVVDACVPFGSTTREGVNQLRDGGCTRIVGVVETQRHRYLEPDGQPLVFLSWAYVPDAMPFGFPQLLVRTAESPNGHLAAVRSAVQGLRPDLPFVTVEPLTEKVRDALLPFRLGAMLFGIFALLALAVSGIGLYGMLGYFVSERTAEIGVRRSLGAPQTDVIMLVVRQTLVPVSIGLLAGLAMALGGSRYLESLLFAVRPHDTLSFLTATAFVMVVAVVATLLPAWRAVRIDPLVALRYE